MPWDGRDGIVAMALLWVGIGIDIGIGIGIGIGIDIGIGIGIGVLVGGVGSESGNGNTTRHGMKFRCHRTFPPVMVSGLFHPREPIPALNQFSPFGYNLVNRKPPE